MAIIRANNNTISAVTALPDAITTGGLVKISTTTVSSAVSSVDFPTIGTDYKFYKLVFNDLHASANDLFSLRFTANNGTAYLSGSTYDYCSQNSTNSSNTQYATNATNRIIFGYWNMSTYSGHASHGEITFLILLIQVIIRVFIGFGNIQIQVIYQFGLMVQDIIEQMVQ